MQISLIVNPPAAGALEEIRAGVEELRRRGHEVEVRLTFEAGDAARFAREAAERGAALVVAAGGDGTVNEVANGLQAHRASRADGEPLRMGIVPLGTANDLASELEIPAEIGAALELAVRGRALEVDVGQVGSRCFLNVSTGGFGAEATEESPDEVKRVLGPLAYVITGAKKFVTLSPSVAHFRAEGLDYEGPFLLFAVGNGRRTGGGNRLTPLADLTDGKLDVCVVKEMSRMDFFTLLPELRAGRHVENPAVLYHRVEELTVEGREELSVNVDGEPLSGRRFHYRLCPHRLPLVVPG